MSNPALCPLVFCTSTWTEDMLRLCPISDITGSNKIWNIIVEMQISLPATISYYLNLKQVIMLNVQLKRFTIDTILLFSPHSRYAVDRYATKGPCTHVHGVYTNSSCFRLCKHQAIISSKQLERYSISGIDGVCVELTIVYTWDLYLQFLWRVTWYKQSTTQSGDSILMHKSVY